jgi:hypothetical protein
MENREIEQKVIKTVTTVRVKTHEANGLVSIKPTEGYIFFPTPGKPFSATILYNPMKGFSIADPLGQFGELVIEWEDEE